MLVVDAEATTGDAAAIAAPLVVASPKPVSAPRVGSTVNWSPAFIAPDERQLQPAQRRRHRRRLADHRAARAVGQRVVGAVERQRVVARRRLRGVRERHGQRRVAGIALIREDGRRRDGEQAAARIARQVDAERVLH
jgi:hypothetical protein